MATSSVQRTMAALRKEGITCGVVERWNQYARGGMGARQDFMGFIDIIAADPKKGIIAIQSCTTSFSAHVIKIIDERTDKVIAWLEAGGKIEIWGWRKVKLKRGGKAMRWSPRVQEITLKDFESEAGGVM